MNKMEIQTENLLILDQYKRKDLSKLSDIIRSGNDFRIFAGFDFHEAALKMLLDDSRKHIYLIYRKNENKLIGYIGLFKNRDGFEPEIYIASEERRKGYGYEVLSFFCDKLLHDQLVHRKESLSCSVLYASCLEENTASNRLLCKCGFKPVKKDHIEICQLFFDPITDKVFDNRINDYYLNR